MMLFLMAAAAALAPACSARELALSTDARDGDFNGMSHSGTYLVIHNVGQRACSVPGLPAVTLRDGRGLLLRAVRQVPVGMHPGPAIVPVTIPAGGRVATGLRWVSGPVYDRSRRLDVRFASVTIGARTMRTPLRASMFAEAGKPATFEQPVLAPFPVSLPRP